MGENGPLRPYRIGVRVTGIHYVDVEAVNNDHAEGQAQLHAIFACGLPNGSRVLPHNGDVRYPIAESAKPVEVRLDVIKNISVVSAERKG
jgi:hypothetical protein